MQPIHAVLSELYFISRLGAGTILKRQSLFCWQFWSDKILVSGMAVTCRLFLLICSFIRDVIEKFCGCKNVTLTLCWTVFGSSQLYGSKAVSQKWYNVTLTLCWTVLGSSQLYGLFSKAVSQKWTSTAFIQNGWHLFFHFAKTVSEQSQWTMKME